MGTTNRRTGKVAKLIILLFILFFFTDSNFAKYQPETKVCKTRNIYKTGVATYYGDRFNHRLTTSGQIFDKNKFTAASRDLPFGTILRVRNTENNKEVIVLVNDRGPVKKTLILDLSEIAAIHLDMVKKGSAHVELEILSSSPNPLQKIFDVYKNLPYCKG